MARSLGAGAQPLRQRVLAVIGALGGKAHRKRICRLVAAHGGLVGAGPSSGIGSQQIGQQRRKGRTDEVVGRAKVGPVAQRTTGQGQPGQRSQPIDVAGRGRHGACHHLGSDKARRPGNQRWVALARQARSFEVGEHRLSFAGEHDIGRRDVTVDDTGVVQGRERACERGTDRGDLALVEAAAGSDKIGEVAPVGQVENQRDRPVGQREDLVQPDDVVVPHPRKDRALPCGQLHESADVIALGLDHLDGDVWTPSGRSRAPHRAGRSRPEQRQDLVALDDRSRTLRPHRLTGHLPIVPWTSGYPLRPSTGAPTSNSPAILGDRTLAPIGQPPFGPGPSWSVWSAQPGISRGLGRE